MSEQALCELCGEPMPAGEEMFQYHGYSGPCPKPPLPTEAPPKAEFVKQGFGAVVATIRETEDGLLEVQDMGDGTFNLTIHSRRGETDTFDDLSIKLENKHFAILGSIAVTEVHNEANVRLITAAPDMLALLIDLYEHGYTTSGDHDRVRATIAKATARNPGNDETSVR